MVDAVEVTGSQALPSTGQRLALGDASLQVLPPPSVASWGANENSVGVIISYGDFSAALTGDMEHRQMDWWLENIPKLLRPVEVYKASHHGSPNGDSQESVSTFQPETVVISVGLNNSYGHPAPEILNLYESVNATVYRTDLQGTVVVTAAEDGTYTVTTERDNAPQTVPSEDVEGVISDPIEPTPITPDIPGLPYDPFGEDCNCGDFSSQAEA